MKSTRKFVAAVSCCLIASTVHAGLEDGLLNYWQFEGDLIDSAPGFVGTASTVADNGVFDGTNGTGGINFGVGLFGAGIEQDGAAGAAQDNGFVRVARSADTLRGGQSVSISAWIQTNGFDTNWQTILAHGEGNQYRIARRSDGDVAAYAGGSADIPGSNIGPDISAGTGWHHILAISENGVSTQIWVDGGLVETGAAPTISDDGNNGAPGGSTPDLYIGANPQTGDNNREWWGEIDDVAIWDRPLDDLEIAVIYETGLGGESLRTLIGAIPDPCDFDGSSMVEVRDLDFLMAEIAAGTNNAIYDVNGDGPVDIMDRDECLLQKAQQDGRGGGAPYKLGDTNLDGFVGRADLNNLGSNWQTMPVNRNWRRGDFTGDGVVNKFDLNNFAINWQTRLSTPAPSHAVPEPSTLALLVAAVALALSRRR